MKDMWSTLDFALSTALCASHFLFAMVKSIVSAIDPLLAKPSEGNFDEFMCTFWFLALCGCMTRRRYIVVFTTMAMFYTFVLSFRWCTAASYSYFTKMPLSCTRSQRQEFPNWCRSSDLLYLGLSVIGVIVTLTASVLSSLRLWSDDCDDLDFDGEYPKLDSLLNEQGIPKEPMISAFKTSLDC
ncbi:hypothetical protein Q1695_003021 [Nippostrongylus brasiliensis]|nr:hypothetical protein Q1695_003021 [Nippostrongylus brasiliensis]